MVCDKCGPNKEKGYTFCPDCGAPLNEGCIYCAQYEKEGYEFCGKCGRPLHPQRAPSSGGAPSPLKMGPMIVMPFMILLLVLELGIAVINVGNVFGSLEGSTFKVLMLLPALTVVGTLSGSGLQAAWVMIFLAILACAAVFLYQSIPMFKPDKDGDTSRAERTPLYWVCLVWGPLTILELLIIGVGVLLGGSFEVPDFAGRPISELIFMACDAAVWEEIIARVLPIGIPMAILALCYGRKDFLKNLLGGFGMSRMAIVLIVLSSLMFGFGHYDGWGLVKVIPTFIAGLFMGYLYVRFGVHASIIFHFITDGMMMFLTSQGMQTLLVALMILILIAGVVCIPTLVGKIRAGLKNSGSIPVTGFEPGNDGKE